MSEQSPRGGEPAGAGDGAAPSEDGMTLAGRRRRSITRNTAVMAAGTAVSRALGFVRNAMLVAAIGATAAAANAYDIANRLPNAMFAILAAGVLNAVLVPQIVRAFQREGGKRTVDRILTLGTVISLVVTIVATLLAPVWVELYTDDWPSELTALAVAFSYWCIPQLFFYCLYTLLGQVLNAREQFGPFMWAPVLNNVVSIAGLGVYLVTFGRYIAPGPAGEDLSVVADLWTPDRIALIGGVATLGIAAQALILLVPLVRGGYHWRWQWRGPKGELSGIGTIAAWSLAAVILEQIGVAMVTQVSAAAQVLPDGRIDTSIAGNAAYFQALSLYIVPHSLVTISLVTAMYTAMARHAANRDMDGLRADLSQGLRSAGVFTVFATVAMIVVSQYLVRVALPTATLDEVQSISAIVIAMTLGLVPLGATVLFKRLYFALEDARAIFFMQIPMSIAWVGTAYAVQALAEPRWWTVGVGLGLAASNYTGMLLRAGGLRRRLRGLDGRRVLTVHVKALVGALAAGVVGWLALKAAPDVEDLSGWSGVFIAGGVTVAAGLVMLVVYAAVTKALKVTELDVVAGPLMRRLPGRRRR
ncbi:murein biosynthesis integral membrane protein MurJ [Demequina sp. NBRC 110057]|uniref:murein biosynthesis integral membrane protein MurJ n=1 Tax=Demequina sp. NBRC 110057 TaxID=1570346 RepID=UPI0009FEDF98|nr:lipid II flippase MurJ [Demequina sp. NBRC 110057]